MGNSWPYSQPNLTVKQTATQIADWMFNQFAKSRGGTVRIMANMRHLWEEIANRNENDAPTILLVWQGETMRGSNQPVNTLTRVDRQWLAVILRGHGWRNLLPNPDAVSERQEEDFYDSVEILRDKIRVMLSVSQEFPLNYKSISPMAGLPFGNTQNVFIDGYSITFSTAADVGKIAYQ